MASTEHLGNATSLFLYLSWLGTFKIEESIDCVVFEEKYSLIVDLWQINQTHSLEETLKPCDWEHSCKLYNQFICCSHNILVLFWGAARPHKIDELLWKSGLTCSHYSKYARWSLDKLWMRVLLEDELDNLVLEYPLRKWLLRKKHANLQAHLSYLQLSPLLVFNLLLNELEVLHAFDTLLKEGTTEEPLCKL